MPPKSTPKPKPPKPEKQPKEICDDIPKKITLAHPWKSTIDPTGYIMSEKLDGMRAYWLSKERKLYSRTGHRIITPDWFVEHFPSDMDLDGELFLDRQKFDECMSITRKNDASGDWSKITFIIFDAPEQSGGILERLSAVQIAGTSTIANSKVNAKVHPHVVCTGMDHLTDELLKIEALGGEGLMLRKASAEHKAGRTNDLLKVKTFHDDEAIVLSYEDGKGKYQGMVGALNCKMRNGLQIKVGSGLTDVQRGSDKPEINSVITFKYFELTKDGMPRFPTFFRTRPDVSSDEFLV